jgi:hypothetical protein
MKSEKVKSPLAQRALRLAAMPVDEDLEPAENISEGRIIAVKICSHVLDACIWLAFDPDFKPDDDEQLAVFYDHEIPILRNRTAGQLKEYHQWKLKFGHGTRVGQYKE